MDHFMDKIPNVEKKISPDINGFIRSSPSNILFIDTNNTPFIQEIFDNIDLRRFQMTHFS